MRAYGVLNNTSAEIFHIGHKNMSIFVNGHYLYQRVTGVQRYAIELLKEFDKMEMPYKTARVPALFRKKRSTRHIWEQFVLPWQVRNSDLLWSPTNTGPALTRNQVITFHDLAVFHHPEWFSNKYVKWRQALIPVLAKRVKGILTVSEFSRGIILEQTDVEPEKVRAVHNGVNREFFYPASAHSIQNMREKFGLEKNYLLTLGSLDPRKNLRRILQAWVLLQKEQHAFDYDLVVAGGHSANFRQQFSPAQKGIQNIKYLGYVDDEYLPPLYSGASGFVYPSLFEGFGLPVLEAMSCGTPVVTSSGGALKEISNGAALSVDPYRAEEIAQGILNLVRSGKVSAELTQKGLKKAELFSWKKAACEIYDYLKEHSDSS